MSAPTKPLTEWTNEEMLAFSERGEALYAEKLKAILEPEQNGKYVAIDVESGEYALGETSLAARQSLPRRHLRHSCYVLQIGPGKTTPTDEKLRAMGALTRPHK